MVGVGPGWFVFNSAQYFYAEAWVSGCEHKIVFNVHIVFLVSSVCHQFNIQQTIRNGITSRAASAWEL